jgi:hypothetical protein
MANTIKNTPIAKQFVVTPVTSDSASGYLFNIHCHFDAKLLEDNGCKLFSCESDAKRYFKQAMLERHQCHQIAENFSKNSNCTLTLDMSEFLSEAALVITGEPGNYLITGESNYLKDRLIDNDIHDHLINLRL